MVVIFGSVFQAAFAKAVALFGGLAIAAAVNLNL
jgi:hypothetical protein